ncbi:MAG: hypothetical protein JJ899_11725, partial [Alphaproteobacteria bacterium]|nr:hypothetical protein [Alphaproteobacteria bacterium]
MTKHLALTLAAGAAAALLFAVPFALGPFAVAPLTLTGVPLMAAGLGIGLLAAIGAGVTGLVLVFALAVLLALSSEPVVLFAGLFVVPVIFAVQQLQRSRTTSLGLIEWHPPLNVMAWLLAGALLAMVVFGVMVIRGNTDLIFLTSAFLEPALTAMLPETGLHRIRGMVETVAPVFPGAVIAAWLVMLAIATAGALALLHFNGALRRPAPRMEDLRTPVWVPLAFGLSVLFVLLGDFNLAYLGRNAAIALLVPMFFVGAGTFHAIARRTPIAYLVNAVFYGFMIVFPPLIALVALVGVADQTLNLRS